MYSPPKVATYKWDPLEDNAWKRRTIIPSNVLRRRIDDDYDEVYIISHMFTYILYDENIWIKQNVYFVGDRLWCSWWWII